MLPRYHLHLHTTRNPSLHLHHVSAVGSTNTTGGRRLHQVRPPQFSLLIPVPVAMAAHFHCSILPHAREKPAATRPSLPFARPPSATAGPPFSHRTCNANSACNSCQTTCSSSLHQLHSHRDQQRFCNCSSSQVARESHPHERTCSNCIFASPHPREHTTSSPAGKLL
ncbi:hypothetical protein DEO72_LG1g2788 [Vigna unguiculata]|uniref:Uncharacterized protein n=1 Tax=Vigna unguiculata TaxID=3917 RepID=A0A4D6KV46_VIGUN|nr:hypothetical protein DEO72_LG1g2788 [Vigna unguiculata]